MALIARCAANSYGNGIDGGTSNSNNVDREISTPGNSYTLLQMPPVTIANDTKKEPHNALLNPAEMSFSR
jgi:hypothetical protein